MLAVSLLSLLAKIIESEGNFGYNAAVDEFGDLIQMGVLDPTKGISPAISRNTDCCGRRNTKEVVLPTTP